MIRVSKLTDYAVIIVAFFSKFPGVIFQTREIAVNTKISKPTVSKILKQLTNNGLLVSHRGASGGYVLSISPLVISIADVIQIMEGPVSITECNLKEHHCFNDDNCSTKFVWQIINKKIMQTLNQIKFKSLLKWT